MPDAAAFLAGFGFVYGSKFGGFTLAEVTSTHKTVSRYHTYEYQITLHFTGGHNHEQLSEAVLRAVAPHHEILSDYGNPYDCWIDPPTNNNFIDNGDGSYTFHLMGHSQRVYHK